MYNAYTYTSIAVIQWLFKAVNGTIKFINKVLERRGEFEVFTISR
ncbi:hypothetical protein LM7420_130453 [Listeria monocytogenes]|nr:hypothetical protein LM7420_130453 [Listeria monocytogenes]CUL37238.1 hypothetical protein LM7423_140012 [Listeria monocytogenes]CUL38740.1 hypothetical protein LM7424_140076 [Listeria monocytogenes]CUL40100.1 hypothetical protein LM7421_140457 [Listeria monocytogenes]CUL40856.1 hypothetical protein LM7422_110012 [Listeria monocytogenes]